MLEFGGSGCGLRILTKNSFRIIVRPLLVMQLIGNLSIYKGNATTRTNYFKYIVISNLAVYDVKIFDLPFKTKPTPRLNYKFIIHLFLLTLLY